MKDDRKNASRLVEAPAVEPPTVFDGAVLDTSRVTARLSDVMGSNNGQDITDGKHTQETLLEYVKVVENLEEMIVVVDREYRYLLANQAFLDYRGVTREQALGHLISEILDQDVFERVVREQLDECFQGKAVKYELTYRCPKRGARRLSISYFPIEGPEGVDRAACVLRDFSERKRAEDSLREAERKYRDIFENASEGIFQSTPEGEYIAANPALAQIYGFESPEEMIRSLKDITRQVYVDPARRQEFKRLVESEGFVRGFEHQILHRDGSKIWVSVNARAVRDQQGETLYYEGTAQDINERKLAEARSATFATLVRKLSGTTTKLGASRIIAETARELFGWDSCNLDLYDADRDLVLPMLKIDIIEGRRVEIADPLPSRKPTARTRRIIDYGPALMLREDPVQFDKDAVPFGDTLKPSASIMTVPILHASMIVGLLSIQSYTRGAYNAAALNDLQALADHCGAALNRISAEESFYESEERFRQMANHFEDVVWLTDKYTRNVLYINPAYERVFRRTSESVYKRLDSFLDKIHPEDRLAVESMLDKEWKGDHTPLEYRIVWPDGSVRWILRRTFPIRNTEGEVYLIAGIAQDITERKRAEESLRKQNEYLAALHETALGLINRLDLKELLEVIVSRACALVGMPGGHVYLLEPGGNEMSVKVGVGVSRDFVGGRISKGQGVAGRIWETGEPLVVDDYRNWEHRLPNAGYDALRLVGSVPLRSGSRVVGVFGVESSEEGQGLDKYQIEILNRFGQLASIALDNAQLHSAAQQELAERKRAEEDISNLRRELELTMDSMEEGVHRVNLKGQIVFENPAAARMLGWQVAELLGKPAHQTMHHTRSDGTPYAEAECPIYAAFRDGISRRVADEVFWRRDGTSFPVEYTVAPMRNDRDEIVAAVVTFRDITDRKRAEEALRESESFRRTIVESEPECVKLVAPDYTLLDMNPAGLAMIGAVSREQVVGLSVLSLIAPEWRTAFKEMHERVCRGDSVVFEFKIVGLTGVRRWMETHAAPLRNKESKVIAQLAITLDVTERKRAEESLKLFRNLIDQSSDAIEVIDPVTLRFVDCNESAHLSLGYTREEFLSLTLSDIDPLVNSSMLTGLDEGMNESGVATLESLHRRKDGTTFPVEINMKLINLESVYRLAVVRDISGRKQAEEALRESEERYRELFENAKDAIYVHDLNGRYVSVNRAAESLSGFPRAEILGKHYSNFVSPRNLKHTRTNLCKKLDDENETIYEVFMITKDKRAVPVEVSSRLIHENGVAVGVQGIVRDITERKRAQDALQNYSRRLIEAQEAERQHIARELHDEIGQVLTAVKINLQSIQRLGPDSAWIPPLDESIGIVDEALGRVRELSIELRPSLLDDLGLSAALRWYVDRYAQRTGIKAEVMNGFEEEGRLPRELETACFRIAQEALTNVVRHGKANSVSVQLEHLREKLVLTISDDGVGFDVEGLFSNASTVAALGLRGMEERALAVKGKIEIESRLQHGTRVRATFPFKRRK